MKKKLLEDIWGILMDIYYKKEEYKYKTLTIEKSHDNYFIVKLPTKDYYLTRYKIEVNYSFYGESKIDIYRYPYMDKVEYINDNLKNELTLLIRSYKLNEILS